MDFWANFQKEFTQNQISHQTPVDLINRLAVDLTMKLNLNGHEIRTMRHLLHIIWPKTFGPEKVQQEWLAMSHRADQMTATGRTSGTKPGSLICSFYCHLASTKGKRTVIDITTEEKTPAEV